MALVCLRLFFPEKSECLSTVYFQIAKSGLSFYSGRFVYFIPIISSSLLCVPFLALKMTAGSPETTISERGLLSSRLHKIRSIKNNLKLLTWTK